MTIETVANNQIENTTFVFSSKVESISDISLHISEEKSPEGLLIPFSSSEMDDGIVQFRAITEYVKKSDDSTLKLAIYNQKENRMYNIPLNGSERVSLLIENENSALNGYVRIDSIPLTQSFSIECSLRGELSN